MSILARAVKAAWNEINTPDTFRKGEEFEYYVRHHLFPKDKYTLHQKTHSYVGNKDDFVENTKEPDFKFQSIETGETFYVEAKYRSSYYQGAVEWCKHYQLRRYREIDKNTPVYAVIGIGQQPSTPEQIFLVPIRQIRYPKLFRSFLKSYEIQTDRCINYSQLK